MKVHVCVIINCMCIDQITLQGLLIYTKGLSCFSEIKKKYSLSFIYIHVDVLAW